jgi:hypothetical protein
MSKRKKESSLVQADDGGEVEGQGGRGGVAGVRGRSKRNWREGGGKAVSVGKLTCAEGVSCVSAPRVDCDSLRFIPGTYMLQSRNCVMPLRR